MQQLRLVSAHWAQGYQEKTVNFEHIKASFLQLSDDVHEVVLELNSHKFLINFKAGLKKLERFEILAVKWFVEVGMKVVHFLRKLVTSLYFEH
jgi:hypothetical protein